MSSENNLESVANPYGENRDESLDEIIENVEISKKTGKPKLKRNYTEEHKQKMRESMAKALEARKAKILERKALREVEEKEHEEKKQQLKEVYEKTKNNKKTKELKDIAYDLLTKANDESSDDDDVIEEIVIKKQPKSRTANQRVSSGKPKQRARSKAIDASYRDANLRVEEEEEEEEEEQTYPAQTSGYKQPQTFIFY